MVPDPARLAAVSLTNPQTLNQYAYVNNNPLNFIDPTGLDGCSDSGSCGDPGWGDPGLGDGNGGVYYGGPIWTEQIPIYNGPQIDPRLIIQDWTTNQNGDDSSWWGDFAKDLFSWQSFAAAQIHAQDAGYYKCLKNEMIGKATAPVATHAAEIATAKGAEEAASTVAGAWFHFTDGRFTAWGRSSEVLVPRLASKIQFGAKVVDAAGWAFFDFEAARAINACAKETLF